MAVHHALVGLLSIATGNRLGHSAIAGGRESFGYGLLEAVTATTEHPERPVLLLHYDDPLPVSHQPVAGPQEESLALILGLAGPTGTPGDVTLGLEPAGRDAAVSESLALDFLLFLLNGSRRGGAVGERMHWRWGRVDVPG